MATGAQGATGNGIASVAKIPSVGWLITRTDGTAMTLTNSVDGANGTKGAKGDRAIRGPGQPGVASTSTLVAGKIVGAIVDGVRTG